MRIALWIRFFTPYRLSRVKVVLSSPTGHGSADDLAHRRNPQTRGHPVGDSV